MRSATAQAARHFAFDDNGFSYNLALDVGMFADRHSARTNVPKHFAVNLDFARG